MRIVNIFIFVLISNTLIKAQSLEGTVLDKSTQKPISGVNIVTSDSINGCSTDMNGRFEINTGNGDPLLISHVGYQNMVLIPDRQKSEIVIYLEQSPVMLNAIQVSVTKNSLPVFLQSASISYLSEKNIQENEIF